MTLKISRSRSAEKNKDLLKGDLATLQCADCNCVENKSKQSVNMLSAPLMVRSWRNAPTWLSRV